MTWQLNTAGTWAEWWAERRGEREKRDKRSDRVREGREDDQYYAKIILKHKQEGI